MSSSGLEQVSLLALGQQDGREQQLKDEVHERLMARCELDPEAGCLTYTGYWDRRGVAWMRVRWGKYTVGRVAAWLYLGVHLWDSGVWVCHRCQNGACANWEHLLVTADPRELSLLAHEMRWGTQRRKRC